MHHWVRNHSQGHIQITRISELNEELIAHLTEKSLSQGFRFMARLSQEYYSGANRFDKTGEALFVISLNGRVIGIGGLNRDPYLDDPNVGRLRHLYVASSGRRQGIGRLLVSQITREASQSYQLLTLRTDPPTANKFYQTLGFKTQPNWEHTTHHLQLSEVDYYPSKAIQAGLTFTGDACGLGG